MVDNEKKVNKSVIINTIGSLLLHGIAFITTPIFSAKLGTANFGIYSVFLTWTSIVTIFFGFQAPNSIPIAQKKYGDIEEQKKFLSSITFLSLISCFVFAAIALVFASKIAQLLKMTNMVYYCLVATSVATVFIELFSAKQLYFFEVWGRLAFSFVKSAIYIGAAVFLLYSVSQEDNYLACVGGYTISCVPLGLFGMLALLVKGKKLVSKEYWTFCLKVSLPLIFHSISTVLLAQSDRIMIQNMIDDSQVGIYSLAVSFTNILVVVWTALNQSWLPVYFKLAKEENREELNNRLNNYFETFTCLSIGFVLLSTIVYRIYAPADYWDGSIFVPLLSISTFLTFLYSIIVNIELYYEKTKIIAVGTVVSCIINIALNYVLIKYYSSLGAVIATVLSHLVLLLMHYIFSLFVVPREDNIFKLRLAIPYTLVFLLFTTLSVFATIYYSKALIIVEICVSVVIGGLELYRILKRKRLF